MTVTAELEPQAGIGPRFSVQLYAARAGAPVNWRLLSGNNRECGRGAAAVVDEAHCRDLLVALQHSLSRTERRCRRGQDGRWVWELTLDGSTVATSGRSFDRLLRCELGVKVFLAELADAPVRATMLVSGARRARVTL